MSSPFTRRAGIARQPPPLPPSIYEDALTCSYYVPTRSYYLVLVLCVVLLLVIIFVLLLVVIVAPVLQSCLERRCNG